IAAVRDRRDDEDGGHDSDRAEIQRGGVAPQRAPSPESRTRAKGEVGFEIETSLVDEVIADMRGAISRRAVRRCGPSVLDRLQRDTHLTIAARGRERFDRAPLLV